MPFGSGYNAQIIAPPAALLAGVLLAGFILELVWPISFVPEGYTLPVGLALIFLAVNLKAFAAREMINIKTTHSLQRPATDLATSSVFAWSRNPIYLGMHGFALWRSRCFHQFPVDPPSHRRLCGGPAQRSHRTGRSLS